MKSEVQSPKSKAQCRSGNFRSAFAYSHRIAASYFLRVFASPCFRVVFILFTAHCSLLTVFAQNNLQKIADGGIWENFNRFNIENLPRKDWFAPFGGAQNYKPRPGTQKVKSYLLFVFRYSLI